MHSVPRDTFDVVVIGGGPAGETVAGRCADHGLSVAIVERELVGGECSYWGCIPSKTLIRPGESSPRLVGTRRRRGRDRSVDVAAAFAQRDYMTSDWNDAGQFPWLDGKGIELVRGCGRLVDEKLVEVDWPTVGPAGSSRTAVVLATGTSAAIPPIPGCASWRHGTTGRSHRPRSFPVGSSCSVVAPSARRWPRRIGASVARR